MKFYCFHTFIAIYVKNISDLKPKNYNNLRQLYYFASSLSLFNTNL
jgi:hypothetical protein